MTSFLFDSKCPYTVTGIHEPNVIMKDNDLKYKIRISRDAARNLLNQIQKDCQFLSSLGVMDYSLLMGVHHAEFDMAALHQSEVTLSNSIFPAGIKATPTPSPPPPPPPPVVSSSRSGRDDSADNENGIMMTVKNPLKGIDVSTVSPPPTSSSSNATPSLSSTRSSNKLSVLHRKHEANKVTGPDYYWIGIIDFLQMWNSQKKVRDSSFLCLI
jgi:1-phosphatidylinositol-4-phosphate 5-kinase